MGVDRASGKATPEHSHRQIQLIPEKPQVVPPGPEETKGPALYPVTFGSPWPLRLHYSQAFVNRLSAKRLETEAWGRRHCGQPSRGEQAAFCITDTEKGWIYF